MSMMARRNQRGGGLPTTYVSGVGVTIRSVGLKLDATSFLQPNEVVVSWDSPNIEHLMDTPRVTPGGTSNVLAGTKGYIVVKALPGQTATWAQGASLQVICTIKNMQTQAMRRVIWQGSRAAPHSVDSDAIMCNPAITHSPGRPLRFGWTYNQRVTGVVVSIYEIQGRLATAAGGEVKVSEQTIDMVTEGTGAALLAEIYPTLPTTAIAKNETWVYVARWTTPDGTLQESPERTVMLQGPEGVLAPTAEWTKLIPPAGHWARVRLDSVSIPLGSEYDYTGSGTLAQQRAWLASQYAPYKMAPNIDHYNSVLVTIPTGSNVPVRDFLFYDVRFQTWKCNDWYGGKMMAKNVKIPDSVIPPRGTDRNIEIYDEATNTVFGAWGARRGITAQGEPTWNFVSCGRVDNFLNSNWTYTQGYTVSASGISHFLGLGLSLMERAYDLLMEARAAKNSGDTVTEAAKMASYQTLLENEGHCIFHAFPNPGSGWSTMSWPATYNDGGSTATGALREGRRFRLRPDFDTSQFTTPFARTYWDIIKMYGGVIADKTVNNIAVTCESDLPYELSRGTKRWPRIMTDYSGNAVAYFNILNTLVNWGADIDPIAHDWGKPGWVDPRP